MKKIHDFSHRSPALFSVALTLLRKTKRQKIVERMQQVYKELA